MNVFIADKDNRDVVSLVYHYCRLGHRVFLPRPGTVGFGVQPSWPRLCIKSTSDPSKRNIEIYGFEKFDDAKFGEDRFLSLEIDDILQKLYDADVTCELIDLDRDKVQIDAWHTTPNAIAELPKWLETAKKYFPTAKWISSCMNHFDHSLAYSPKNIVKFLPANYRNIRPDVNQACLYRHRIEFDVLNVNYNTGTARNGWASFNHNFAVRHPTHYAMQHDVNKRLNGDIEVKNFGGNIRQMGADIKFSDENGLTGTDKTLSPRQAMKKYTELRGVLHLKQNDWAGGVPAMSRMASTPIVVHSDYVRDTLADNVLIHNQTCLVGSSVDEISDFVRIINNDDALFSKLSEGQNKMNESLFDDRYWASWEQFLWGLE